MKSRVEVVFPVGTRIGEAFASVVHPSGVWANQSPDAAPVWAASDNQLLARLVGEHWQCEVRDPLPEGERGEHADRVHHLAPIGGGVA